MLLNPLLMDKTLWPIPFVLQALAYIGVLRKMDIPFLWAFIPAGADYQVSRRMFKYQRSFWRPFLIAAILIGCAYYLNPFAGTGMPTARIYLIIAMLVYECFLFRLYYRLCKAFGKRLLLALLTGLIPPLGLAILSFGKAQYLGDPVFPESKAPKWLQTISRFGFIGLSLVEAAAFMLVVAFFTVRAYPPRFLAQYILNDTLENTKDVTGTGTVITPADTMGTAAADIASMPRSREKFYPDHSQDKSVVVIEYFIGSDLEDRAGLASANIAQMFDASSKGSGLTFVIQAGGSQRWFTKGIQDGTYGRYAIHDGKMTKAMDLPSDTCMSEPDQLADFISWAVDTYPADRYILAFWDHGSGFSLGYGYDALNKRKAESPLLSVSEIIDGIAKAGVKFDIIGFDACLMQDIEVAAALEPYADYFLASEEVEGGYGWSYTSAFGMLAQNPSLPSEEFGREIVACYDPYNTIIAGGQPDTSATLSFVDLPLAKAAYEQMEGFFSIAREELAASPASFANLSLAGTKSYTFQNYEQVDLVDFITHLDRLDMDDVTLTPEERDALLNAVRACVLYRNGDSATGVNGIALTFPVQAMDSYSSDYKLFNAFSFDAQRDLYSDFFSIMAAQKMKAASEVDPEKATFLESLNALLTTDYTKEEWYVAGFEDYDDTPALLDIPLTEVEGGYQINLPEAGWDIIADAQLIAYQRAEDGTLRYLGHDNIGATDANGHPMVAMEGTWVHLADRVVAYESTGSRETEEGTVFTGTTTALINGTDKVRLFIEWDPVTEETTEVKGHVVGYESIELAEALSELTSLVGDTDNPFVQAFTGRGKEQLQPGDRVDFLFDYYDEEGNLVATEAYGRTMVVTSQEDIVAEDKPLATSDVIFGGVLTDVYQRTMTTEKIEAHVA